MAALAALGQVNKSFTHNLSFQLANLPGHGYRLGMPSYLLTFPSLQATATQLDTETIIIVSEIVSIVGCSTANLKASSYQMSSPVYE